MTKLLPTTWPQGDDGDVFRSLAAQGFDFLSEHVIDFNVDFADWPPPAAALAWLESEFPNATTVYPPDGELDGYVLVKVTAKLTYALVINAQQRLSEAMATRGGNCQSWGVLNERPLQQVTARSRAWLSTNAEHEGFPIYFRRPDVRVAEFEAVRPSYPRLLVVTHSFAHVKKNGLPESQYNKSLEFLDASLVSPFRDESQGLIAVIETFAGRRTYYIYLAPSFDAGAYMKDVAVNFPRESLSHEESDDADWLVFRGYASQFRFT